MSTQRAVKLALLMLVAAKVAQAQKFAADPHSDTLTIAKDDSPGAVRVRLVNAGAHVLIVGLTSQLVADTIVITTPVQVVLPAQAFNLSVSSSEGASVTMLHNADSPTGPVRYRNTFYAPFTLMRLSANGPLRVQGARMRTDVVR